MPRKTTKKKRKKKQGNKKNLLKCNKGQDELNKMIAIVQQLNSQCFFFYKNNMSFQLFLGDC